MSETVAVALAGLAGNLILAFGTLAIQMRRERLDFRRSTRRLPYSQFGQAVERCQVAIDSMIAEQAMDVDLDEARSLLEELEASRVDTDIVGSQPVRDWAFRAVLCVRNLYVVVPRGDVEATRHFRAKLHDARKAWVRSARREVGVTAGERRGGFGDGVRHDEWCRNEAEADGLANADEVLSRRSVGSVEDPPSSSRSNAPS